MTRLCVWAYLARVPTNNCRKAWLDQVLWLVLLALGSFAWPAAQQELCWDVSRPVGAALCAGVSACARACMHVVCLRLSHRS